MASPQKEDGFTPIANELLEAFTLCKMQEYERVLVLCLWRKTYGWSKKSDWVSLSQFNSMSGIPSPHVSRTLKSLKEKNIVTCSGKKLSVNKHWDEWKIEWRGLPHQVIGVTSSGNKKVTSSGNHKRKKETIQKKLETTVSLNEKKMKKNSWKYNESKHQDFEDVIDLDSGEKVVEKKVVRKYKEIYAVFKEVLGVQPLNWTVNKTQQQSAENLYTERGIEQVRKALQSYLEVKDVEFCPTVTSPYDLDSKWSKLFKFIKSQ